MFENCFLSDARSTLWGVQVVRINFQIRSKLQRPLRRLIISSMRFAPESAAPGFSLITAQQRQGIFKHRFPPSAGFTFSPRPSGSSLPPSSFHVHLHCGSPIFSQDIPQLLPRQPAPQVHVHNFCVSSPYFCDQFQMRHLTRSSFPFCCPHRAHSTTI